MSQAITGIFNILATPFDADQQLDLESLKRLVSFQMSLDVAGLTILGVLGEAAKLSVEERQQVMHTVMETVQGRIPVVVGTSHPDKATCIRLSQEAQQAGATAVMIAPPPMPGASDEQVIAFYEEVAAETGSLGIVAQDYPLINNITMSADMLAALAERVATVRHLKLEDPPLMQKISAILSRTDKLQIFGGLGGMFLLEELRRGTHGTMTGFAFSEILVAIFDAHQAGQHDEASRIFDHYLPLIRFENQPVINLTIRKELLRRRGSIAHATPRKPFNAIDEGTHMEIDSIFERVGIQDPSSKLTFTTGVNN